MNHKTLSIALLTLGLAACGTTAPPAVAPSTDARVLLGTWSVDLRPQPDAPPYLQTLVVSGVSAGTFQGRFYNTPITEGRINTSWGTVRIAFVTADGNGSYHHSAVLAGGRLEGLSNATARGFLAYWSAVKSAP